MDGQDGPSDEMRSDDDGVVGEREGAAVRARERGEEAAEGGGGAGDAERPASQIGRAHV